MTKATCALSKHSSVDMTDDTVKNLEAFLSLKEELQTMKNTGTDKLAMAIQKRKEIQEHLDFLIKSLTATMEEIQEFQDENNLIMTEMVSTLEGNVLMPGPAEAGNETKDFFLSELLSIVGDSKQDDTAETLKVKLNKSAELCEQNLLKATASASEYELCKKMRITVNLYDEEDRRIPTCSWFDDGFRLLKKNGSDGLNNAGALVRQDLILLSHVVFSLLRKKKVNLKSEQDASSSGQQSNLPVPSIPDSATIGKTLGTKLPSLFSNSPTSNLPLPSTSSITNVVETQHPKVPLPVAVTSFALGHSIFIMRLAQRGITKGEIHIQPVTTFHPDFMTSLGNFCFQSPKVFCLTNVKVEA